MPHFEHSPFPCRYNSLRLLGYDYSSVSRLCAMTLVTESRRPVFADMKLAKRVLASLLSDQMLSEMRLRAFTLMPDHLHLLAGVQNPDTDLPTLIGQFKSFSTQLYWKRSREIVASAKVSLPSLSVTKAGIQESEPLLHALADWNTTLRPEAVALKNWPTIQPSLFLDRHLWQTRFFDHVIRNEKDLNESLDYIAFNPVCAGYVTQPFFYPYTGFLREDNSCT
jgi:REP element-mobilizing transposase RayT